MDERAAQPCLEATGGRVAVGELRRRLDLRQAEPALEVVAVAALDVVGQARVAQRRGRRRALVGRVEPLGGQRRRGRRRGFHQRERQLTAGLDGRRLEAQRAARRRVELRAHRAAHADVVLGRQGRDVGHQGGRHPGDRRAAGPRRRPRVAQTGRARDDQALLGAGQRDVQDPPLLGVVGAPALGGDRLEVQRLRALALEVDEPQPDAVAVDEQVGVRRDPLAAEVGDDHDGELEALGGVDRHQAHGVEAAEVDGRVGLARVGLELGGGEVDEPAHVATAARLELGGEAPSACGRSPGAARRRAARGRAGRSRCARRRAPAARRARGAAPRALLGEPGPERREPGVVGVGHARGGVAERVPRPPPLARGRRSPAARARPTTRRPAARPAAPAAPRRRAGWPAPPR